MTSVGRPFLRRGDGIARFGNIQYPALKLKSTTDARSSNETSDKYDQNEADLNNNSYHEIINDEQPIVQVDHSNSKQNTTQDETLLKNQNSALELEKFEERERRVVADPGQNVFDLLSPPHLFDTTNASNVINSGGQGVDLITCLMQDFNPEQQLQQHPIISSDNRGDHHQYPNVNPLTNGLHKLSIINEESVAKPNYPRTSTLKSDSTNSSAKGSLASTPRVEEVDDDDDEVLNFRQYGGMDTQSGLLLPSEGINGPRSRNASTVIESVSSRGTTWRQIAADEANATTAGSSVSESRDFLAAMTANLTHQRDFIQHQQQRRHQQSNLPPIVVEPPPLASSVNVVDQLTSQQPPPFQLPLRYGQAQGSRQPLASVENVPLRNRPLATRNEISANTRQQPLNGGPVKVSTTANRNKAAPIIAKEKLEEFESLLRRLRDDQLYLQRQRSFICEVVAKTTKDREEFLQEKSQFDSHREIQLGRLKADWIRVQRTESAAKKVLDRQHQESEVLRQQLLDLNQDKCEQEAQWASERTRRRAELDRLRKENETLKAEKQKLQLRAESHEKHVERLDTENRQLRVRLRNKRVDSVPLPAKNERSKSLSPTRSILSSSGMSSMGSSSISTPKQVRFNLPSSPPIEDRLQQANPTLPVQSAPQSSTSVSNGLRVSDNFIHHAHTNPQFSQALGSTRSSTQSVFHSQNLEPDLSLPNINTSSGLSRSSNMWRMLPGGSREIIHQNQTVEQISADGFTRSFWYVNGDIRKVNNDGTEVYTYSGHDVTVITKPDGTRISKHRNGVTETRTPAGFEEVRYADGTVAIRYADEQSISSESPLGNKLLILPDGTEELTLPDGVKEIRTTEYKKRVYPDGSEKVVFPDGHQESRYANGRIRVKDAAGNLIEDRQIQTTAQLN